MKEKFMLVVETLHVDDTGGSENVSRTDQRRGGERAGLARRGRELNAWVLSPISSIARIV